MKSSLFVVVMMLAGAAANAAPHVDMSDPRRALGREDDIRIDAQLFQDTLQPSGPINVAYQIENLSNAAVAVADRVVEVDFNPDDGILTLSIGAETLTGKTLPHLVVIAPGEKRTLKAGSVVRGVQSGGGPFTSVPRAVQIRVNVLRDLAAFRDAIAVQQQPNAAVAVTNEMFDRWIDANDSIDLNSLPVKWSSQPASAGVASADRRSPTAPRSGMW